MLQGSHPYREICCDSKARGTAKRIRIVVRRVSSTAPQGVNGRRKLAGFKAVSIFGMNDPGGDVGPAWRRKLAGPANLYRVPIRAECAADGGFEKERRRFRCSKEGEMPVWILT